jgi:hypothetical protein
MRRLNLIPVILAITLCSQAGCQFMPHALQPNQLWKLNRHPPMDVRFQSPDSLDETECAPGRAHRDSLAMRG